MAMKLQFRFTKEISVIKRRVCVAVQLKTSALLRWCYGLWMQRRGEHLVVCMGAEDGWTMVRLLVPAVVGAGSFPQPVWVEAEAAVQLAATCLHQSYQ